MTDVAITDSILLSVKKLLGADPDYDVFDPDIIMCINSAFGTLQQLGVGPIDGFRIDGPEDMWNTYTTNGNFIDEVKTYVYMRVKLMFDPPSSSFVLDSYKEQIKELEWRLSVKSDEYRGTKVDD